MHNTHPTLWQRITRNMFLYATITSILEVFALAAIVFIAFPQAGMLDLTSMLLLLAVAFPMSLVMWSRMYKPKPNDT